MIDAVILEGPAGQRRERRPAAERRQEIVAAVIVLARECGPEAVTTQAIADRVGVTQGAVFRHFPDKEAIWAAVFDWVRAELGGVVATAFAAGGTPLAVLERVFLAHVGFVAAHPGVPRILFNELQKPADSRRREPVRRMVAGYRQRLVELFVAARDAGELSPELDAEAAAVLFLGTVQGLVVQSLLFPGAASMEAAARRLLPLLLDGFRGARR